MMSASASTNEILSRLNVIQETQSKMLNQQVVIQSHPLVFITLVLLFFITIDVWTVAVQSAIKYFHPNKELEYWEYFIIAVLLLIILVGGTYFSGIQVKSLGG